MTFITKIQHYAKYILSITCLFIISEPIWVTAQVMPTKYLIWDSFEYESTEDLFNTNYWHTNLSGTDSLQTRAWYKHVWFEDDEWAYDPKANVYMHTIGSERHLRLETEAGYKTQYGNGVNTPSVSSGFTAQTGTWVSRIRFDDITRGTATDSSITQSFWTGPVYVACQIYSSGDCAFNKTAPYDTSAHWSEINVEYVNNDYPPFQAYPDTLSIVNGASFNGPPFNDSYKMKNPNGVAGQDDLSCYQQDGGLFTHLNAYQCRDWFISNSNSDHYAILLLQYDGEDLNFAAVAYDWSGGGDLIYMDTTYSIGKAMQPMQVNYLHHNNQISDATLGYSVDWFLYYPDTDVEIFDADNDAWWLNSNSKKRINTTQINLNAPSTTVLDTEIYTPLSTEFIGSNDEWVTIVKPRYRTSRIEIDWYYRTKLTAIKPWSSWTPIHNQGFYFDFEEEEGNDESHYYAVEVGTYVKDMNFSPNDSTWSCGQIFDFGSSDWNCGGMAKTGNIVISKPADSGIPKRFRIGDNYPNPFSSHTMIEYDVPNQSHVEIKVYDILGREVDVLTDQIHEAGSYKLVWRANDVPSGSYIYKMMSGTFTDTKISTLIR